MRAGSPPAPGNSAAAIQLSAYQGRGCAAVLRVWAAGGSAPKVEREELFAASGWVEFLSLRVLGEEVRHRFTHEVFRRPALVHGEKLKLLVFSRIDGDGNAHQFFAGGGAIGLALPYPQRHCFLERLQAFD